MTLSTSPRAYEDCYAVMQAALSDPSGVASRFGSQTEANMFRLRCHYARTLERKANAQTYPVGHHMHNTSAYDGLILRVREADDAWWVTLEANALGPTAVVSLSSGAAVQLELGLPAPAPRALPAPTAPTDTELGEAFEAITVEQGPDSPEPLPEPAPAPTAPTLRRL